MTLQNIALGSLLFAAVSCGSGGTGTTLTAAALTGTVYQLDGQTGDRSGVTVTVRETGERLVTRTDGTFRFPRIPTGAVTLVFGRALRGIAHEEDGEHHEKDGEHHEEDGEHHEEDGDHHEEDGDHHEEDGDHHEEDGEHHEEDGEHHEEDGEHHEEDGDHDEEDGEHEDEHEDDIDEDHDGNPMVRDIAHGDEIDIRVAIDGNRVTEFSADKGDGRAAKAELHRAKDSVASELRGFVKIESRPGLERFVVVAEHLAPEAGVLLYVGDALVGDPRASATGVLEFSRRSDVAPGLPLGVGSVADLSGKRVEVRLAEGGVTVLVGEVPHLPSAVRGEPGSDKPLPSEHARGKARLVAHFPGLEGYVEIRVVPETGEQRLAIRVEGLDAGAEVRFRLEHPELRGVFETIATVHADGEGDASISTNHGLPMPFGVSHVSKLVGLGIRVIRGGASDALLMTGEIPALVGD